MSRAGAGSLRERMQQGAAAKKMQADKFVGLVEKKSANICALSQVHSLSESVRVEGRF